MDIRAKRDGSKALRIGVQIGESFRDGEGARRTRVRVTLPDGKRQMLTVMTGAEFHIVEQLGDPKHRPMPPAPQPSRSAEADPLRVDD